MRRGRGREGGEARPPKYFGLELPVSATPDQCVPAWGFLLVFYICSHSNKCVHIGACMRRFSHWMNR